MPIIYEERRRKFCNQSCAAKYNNKFRSLKSREKQRKSLSNNEKFNYLNENITSKRYKKMFPYCPVEFLICETTGLPYCNKNSNGEQRQKSPYLISKKENYYNLCKFKFNVYHYPEEFDLKLLEEYGWYTCPGQKRKHYAKNVNGISRDHSYSISEGLKNNINPLLLSHPANCKLMIHLDNKRKHSNCEIIIDKLKEKILKWEDKYNTFPNIRKLL